MSCLNSATAPLFGVPLIEDKSNNFRRLCKSSLLRRLLHIPIHIKPAARIQINCSSIDPPRSPIIQPGTKIAYNDHDDRNIICEEGFSVGLFTERPNRQVEFGDDEDYAPRETPPCGVGEGPGFPGEVGNVAALSFPGVSHADMG